MCNPARDWPSWRRRVEVAPVDLSGRLVARRLLSDRRPCSQPKVDGSREKSPRKRPISNEAPPQTDERCGAR
jgi:hypothetical protein